TLEKLRLGVTEGVANDPFRRWLLRGGRADVRVEIEPGHTAEAEGQILEQSLGNETQLDVPLVSGELAADVGAVNLGLALYILLATAAADGADGSHPEAAGRADVQHGGVCARAAVERTESHPASRIFRPHQTLRHCQRNGRQKLRRC